MGHRQSPTYFRVIEAISFPLLQRTCVCVCVFRSVGIAKKSTTAETICSVRVEAAAHKQQATPLEDRPFFLL